MPSITFDTIGQVNTGTSGAWTTLVSVPTLNEYIGTIRATLISTDGAATTAIDVAVSNSTAAPATSEYILYQEELEQGAARDYTSSLNVGKKVLVRSDDSVTFSFHGQKKDNTP